MRNGDPGQGQGRGAGLSSDHAQRLGLVSAGCVRIRVSGAMVPNDRAFLGIVDERAAGDRQHSGHDWQSGSRIAAAGQVGRRRPGSLRS